MNEIEAKRIAAVVSIIRPDWRQGLVMAVLSDERLRHRVYEDVLVAAVSCYSDPTTAKPGRIHEPGRWWLTVTATAPAPQYRTITDDDCGICTRPKWVHPIAGDDHAWEPQHGRGKGEAPTPEQRAEIDRANAEAKAKVTAEREAIEAKKVRDMDDVLASHAPEAARHQPTEEPDMTADETTGEGDTA